VDVRLIHAGDMPNFEEDQGQDFLRTARVCNDDETLTEIINNKANDCLNGNEDEVIDDQRGKLKEINGRVVWINNKVECVNII
jgi:hypothetical protein